MKKSLAILATAGVVALGGTAAVSAASDAGTTIAPSAVTLTAEDGTRPNILTDVLASLVTDGTITQAQSDKIVSTLETRRTEMKAEREAARAQMETFLDDGQITLDELRSLRGPGGFGGRGHGHGFGGGPLDGDDAPASNAAPTTSSS